MGMRITRGAGVLARVEVMVTVGSGMGYKVKN